MKSIKEEDRQMRYSPRKNNCGLGELGEGVIEVKCHSVDCVHNDRTRINNGQFGFCNCDEIEWGGRCHSYQMDIFYMAYTLHEDVETRKNIKHKINRDFKKGGGVWVES